jgi:CRISPR-associated endoribonuclease Cas6
VPIPQHVDYETELGTCMVRVILELASPLRIRYRDSLHAALVTAFRAGGLAEETVIGPTAASWTFAMEGRSFAGGGSRIHQVMISTTDRALGDSLVRLDPATIRYASSNGDLVDFAGAQLRPEPLPLHAGQDMLTVGFASPFLITERGAAKKGYARCVAGLDLSAAFSIGLSRRLRRSVHLEAIPDSLSALTDGAKPVLVRVRKCGTRDLILPALSVILTLRGEAADLRDAYLGGLGEKTRYGFGCPVVLA